MTANMVESAKGSTLTNKEGEVVVVDQPKPGYYALLPLTVVGDIATSPFQLILLMLMRISGIDC